MVSQVQLCVHESLLSYFPLNTYL